MSSIAFKTLAGVFVAGFVLHAIQAGAPATSRTQRQPAEKRQQAGPAWDAGPKFFHRGRVTALAVGAAVIAVGDDQAHLALWDVRTGKKIETLHQGSDGGQQTIDGVWISRDGTQFVKILNRGEAMHQASISRKGRDYSGFAGSGDWVYYGVTGDSKRWLAREASKNDLLLQENDHANGKFQMIGVAKFPHTEKVTHAAGEGEIIVSVAGLSKATLRRWAPGKEKALWEFDLGGADVTSLLVSPDAKLVAVTGDAGLVQVFDADSGKSVSKANGLTGIISGAAFGPDGKWLVVGCRDGSARVLDAKNGKELAILKGHEDRVLAVAVGPDSTITTGGADKSVRVWRFRE